MNQKMTQKELVRNFVQNVLGCGCPEGVFEEIEVKQGPVDIDGIPVTRSIKVGGRLLIYIILSEDLNDGSDSLKALIQSGKKCATVKGSTGFGSWSPPGLLAQTGKRWVRPFMKSKISTTGFTSM